MSSAYEGGSWSCAYQVSPVAVQPSLPALRQILLEVKGHETGWPVWLADDGPRPEMNPRVAGESIECWLKDTPDLDFWRAHTDGRLFLIRRFQEDYDFSGVPPGLFFDITLPIWRTGECLLHASRFASRVEAERVDIMMTWRGLAGRHLRALASPLRMVRPGHVCNEPEVTTHASALVAEISDTLPEIVKALVSPLFARFNFFEPTDELYSGELFRLRNRTA